MGWIIWHGDPISLKHDRSIQNHTPKFEVTQAAFRLFQPRYLWVPRSPVRQPRSTLSLVTGQQLGRQSCNFTFLAELSQTNRAKSTVI